MDRGRVRKRGRSTAAVTVVVLLCASGVHAEGPGAQRAPHAWGSGVVFGDNESMRVPSSDAAGLYADGAIVAARWRMRANDTTLIALRHDLFAEQDHPFDQRAYAKTLPPSWVSVGLEHARRRRPWPEVRLPWLLDHAAWEHLDVAAAFAPFPVDATLARFARARGQSPSGAARAQNARATLRALAEHVHAMRPSTSPEDVVRLGCARIVAGDELYFGAAREHVVVLTIERPDATHPRGGFVPARGGISSEVARVVTVEVLAARLAAGPAGVGAYDLSDAAEARHLELLLEALVPWGSSGHPLWVELISTEGFDPRRFAGAAIELSRLRFFTLDGEREAVRVLRAE